MKRTIEITYNYDTSEMSRQEKLIHVGEMENEAINQILDGITKDCMSGELSYHVMKNLYTGEPETSWPVIEVKGNWEYKLINKEE